MPAIDSPTVVGITIYPIKSCHYIELNECEVDNLGIKNDRRFMLVNKDTNRFVTQRRYSSLSLLKSAIDEEKNTITLTAEGQNPLVLPLTQEVKKLDTRLVQLWKAKLTVYDMGEEAAAWTTQFLINHRQHDQENNHNPDEPIKSDEPVEQVRLVTLDDPREGVYSRPSHPKLDGIHTAFCDWSPISFGFVSSLADVNRGLLESGISKGNQIPMNRFRNNITIDGTIPWEEDQWLVVKIGEVTAYIIQPIARCTVPGIDQDTGKKDEWDGKGPVDYLKIKRQFKEQTGEGRFCCDVVPLTSGKIRIGDKIQVLERIPEKFQKAPVPST